MTDETLARAMGLDQATATKMREEYAALDIEWHCEGRHGVIRNVPSAKAGRVQRVLEWHYGGNCARWTSPVKGKRSVEFVHMTKVYPPPRKPWEWCGTTVLFEDWQQREDKAAERRASFRVSQPVWFEHKGVRYDGFVTKINRKTIGVMIPNQGEWRIGPNALNAS